jgi:hypothetical protein
MDRISALRNVEAALRQYEAGEIDLAGLEERVGAVLRTYATEFETADLAVYRASGGTADGTIVAAETPAEARERIVDQYDAEDLEFELEQLG